MSHNNSEALPAITGLNYNASAVNAYLSRIQAENRNVGFGVCSYSTGLGTNPVANCYGGGIYSPTQNRIYLMPLAQCAVATWHYIDCNTGAVVGYTHGLGTTLVSAAYAGGVYDPLNDRIFLCPCQVTGGSWHYIDCRTGTVVAYSNGSSTIDSGAYQGGSYHPLLQRIYLSPTGQGPSGTWHYISCSASPTVSTYANSTGYAAQLYAYYGSCYSPTNGRVYFTPETQVQSSWWHYVDSSGTVVAYANTTGLSGADKMCAGGVYSPMQDRIYLCKYNQNSDTSSGLWYYINCSDASIGSFEGGAATQAYSVNGGSYSPVTNRIYLAPTAESSQASWFYIDCSLSTPSIAKYSSPSSPPSIYFYYEACFSPSQNRVYFIPNMQSGSVGTWHYIQEYSTSKVSPALMAGPSFNH